MKMAELRHKTNLLTLMQHDKNVNPDSTALKTTFNEGNDSGKGFRGEEDGDWVKPEPIGDETVSTLGGTIAELQGKLRQIGLFPHGDFDGVYGYRTMSSVRLFQEYVRQIEKGAALDVDGIYGPATKKELDRWLRDSKQAAWGQPSNEHKQAIKGLRDLQQIFSKSKLKGIQLLNENAARSDSRAVADWSFDEDEIHLIGLRRNENVTHQDWKKREVRDVDDIFVLLVGGMRWVFRGSTNPSPHMTGSRLKDQPFILRGQHEYRNGWHQWNNNKGLNPATYRAYRPASGKGVLIVRTVNKVLLPEDKWTTNNIEPNGSINIHWSGSGGFNFSAGCQVIAGNHYVDFKNQYHDLSDRAAPNHVKLDSKHTRGAYNVMIDLITVFQNKVGKSGDRLLYTLLYDDDVVLTEGGADIDFESTVKKLT